MPAVPRATFGRRTPAPLAQEPTRPVSIAPAAAPVTNRGWPKFTISLLVVLAIIYAVEVKVSGSGLTPAIDTLSALGALDKPMIFAGQWWRIFTGPLLHGSMSHIFFNSLALLLIGLRLERLIGSRWFAGIFVVSAVCGSLMSLAINPANLIGVGASGGIVGLFAAALFASSRVTDKRLRARLINGTLGSLVPALLPSLSSAHSSTLIDYGAHFGGAIGGVLVGIVMLRLWPKSSDRPLAANLPAAVAGAFFLVAAGAVLPITQLTAVSSQLMPASAVADAAKPGQSEALVATYPHDPRLRLFYGQDLLREGRLADAEVQLRAGLSETQLLKTAVPPVIEALLRVLLGATLVDEKKMDEARTIVQPACGAPGLPDTVTAELKKEALCS